MERQGQTITRERPAFDHEPTWAEQLGLRMDALKEIASRIQAGVHLAEEDVLMEGYAEIEREKDDLLEFGRARGWVA